jgi:hypothetical protein
MSAAPEKRSDRVGVELIDDEKAIALAEKLARRLKRTVVVTDSSGKEICIAPARRELDS